MGLMRRERRSVSAEEVVAAVMAQRTSGAVPPVTAESAMRLSAVWACVRLIAGVGSTMPVDVMRGQDTIAPAFFEQPDPDLSLTSWLYQLWSSLLLAGNAYGLVTGLGGNGWPRAVQLLDPARVSWAIHGDKWTARLDGKPLDVWPNGPLWHIPLFPHAGCPYGMSPISAAKQSISTGLSAEKFGLEFFGGGGHPTSIVYSETPLTDEQAASIKESYLRATRGREPAVMGAGLKVDQVQVSPTDSQFIETQRFSMEQIARIFGVPPELIGAAVAGTSVTYQNRDQRAADWLAFGLMPYMLPIEGALTSLVPRPQRVRFNVDGLLRSDLASRYASYHLAAPLGILSINEIRALEELPDIGPEGDDHTPYKLVANPASAEPSLPDPTADPQGGTP